MGRCDLKATISYTDLHAVQVLCKGKGGAIMRMFDLYPRVCKICGKRFESRVNYTYKVEYRKNAFYYFCSYHCFREYEKRKKVAG